MVQSDRARPPDTLRVGGAYALRLRDRNFNGEQNAG